MENSPIFVLLANQLVVACFENVDDARVPLELLCKFGDDSKHYQIVESTLCY